MTLNEIVVQGAREHNLKGVDLRVPRGTLTTITGVSGSGKSSLAFDTIFQEGQRRFIESLSSYARQFLGNLEKPKVDRIDGLSPTISIDQKTVNRNPRSTVGTITEIYDHLRLLFARLGIPHCPRCERALSAQTKDQIADRLLGLGDGKRVYILAPVVRGRKGEYRKEFDEYRLKGFVRARVDGEIRRLDEKITLDRYKKHDIDVVIDRLVISADRATRISEAVDAAAQMADGVVAALVDDEYVSFSSRLACPDCGIDFPELEPRLFSFNSPYGACTTCSGLGSERRFDRDLLVADGERSIRDGALAVMRKDGYLSYSRLGPDALAKVGKAFGFTLDQPWNTLTKAQQDVLFYGSGETKVRLKWEYVDQANGKRVKGEDNKPVPGVIPAMEHFYRVTRAPFLEKFLTTTLCSDCEGHRLGEVARAVSFRDVDICHLSSMTVEAGYAWFQGLELTAAEHPIGREVVKEITSRLSFLVDVGLGYLPLDRGARTLSGGEAQRVRLATQVGAQLQGVLYVLDEPSIGLHQRDNHRLIGTLRQLRDRGNTVLVVEHDRDTMLASDYLVDVGPGAGSLGGEIVVAGEPLTVFEHPASATARHLRGEEDIEIPAKPRKGNGHVISVRGARQHNLKNIDVDFPLGCLVAVTGVSGSGKSTLIDGVLKRALARQLHGATDRVGEHDRIDGVDQIDKVVEIDQSPIGRTPRSNPATYSGAFTHIRDLFAMLPESKARGYAKGRFSFNVKGGRCEECLGAGVKIIEMQLLADVEVPCDACEGMRYNRETLEIVFREKNVRQILEMTIEEAYEFFANHPKLERILGTMLAVGLGYVSLGQTATTLSGGEAQRLKLAAELSRPGTGQTLYLLDEPTTGLHFRDVVRLIAALQSLVEKGNSVVVIEHNLDVVKVSDHLIDLGPEGGAGGGEIVFAGTVKQALRSKRSWTGRLLKEYLKPAQPNPNPVRRSEGGGDGAALRLFGATCHNLKGVDVEIPHGKLTVITGVSGSGKTSLAFDTIFAEAQRRFVESMSTYARRFLSRMDRPPVERIEGLAPAIAIDRRAGARNPRSTVSTTTEIYDYLRILYARVGDPHCPDCAAPMRRWSPSAAARDAIETFSGSKVMILAPLVGTGLGVASPLASGAEFKAQVKELLKRGFVRAMIQGKEVRLDEPLPRITKKSAPIELVTDRVGVRANSTNRLSDAFEQAFGEGNGVAIIRDFDGSQRIYTEMIACPQHGHVMLEPAHPRLFSFNSHLGACPTCDGIGRTEQCDIESLYVDETSPLFESALTGSWSEDLSKPHFGVVDTLNQVADAMGFDLRKPVGKLPKKARDAIFYGYDETVTVEVVRESKDRTRHYEMEVEWEGIIPRFEQKYRNTVDGQWWRRKLAPLMIEGPCSDCGGERLNPLARSFQVGGTSLGALQRMTVDEAKEFLVALKLDGERELIARDALTELLNRVSVLSEIGLGYLELGRVAATLSGGEAQRIRLATQLGNRLVGVLYVLDEPTIGLHSRDTERLIGTLKGLRDLGNTIVVVEHDLDLIRAADHIIDVGPAAGQFGGTITSAGTLSEVTQDANSLTGSYLRGEREVAVPTPRRRVGPKRIQVRGARLHNLKKIDVDIPLGVLTCVTGVSGSGKSSLIMDLLEPAVRARLVGGRYPREPFDSVTLPRDVDALAVVDQTPLGPTPASNPATYTGIFDPIREVFASTPAAKMKGFTKRRFSFNLNGGRCEACEGKGVVQVEMHFLSDVYIPCDACGGKRFDRETLAVTFGGKSIADVLEMEVDPARDFFKNHRRIGGMLDLLSDVGLGYMRLGQAATTLSGGEAQRVKLATALGVKRSGHTLYILDEPTTGLHIHDVQRLIDVLGRLVNAGNTLLVIEHNPDLIKCADYLIDLGPEGGEAGGYLLAAGTPEEVASVAESETATRLRSDLVELPTMNLEASG